MKNIIFAFLLMSIISVMAIPDELTALKQEFEEIKKDESLAQMYKSLPRLKEICKTHDLLLQKYVALNDEVKTYINEAGTLESIGKSKLFSSKERVEKNRQAAEIRLKLSKTCVRVAQQFSSLEEKK